MTQNPGQKYSKHRPITSRKMRGAVARRKQVAELRLKGWTNQADIARELGVHRSMIHRDFEALDREWGEHAARDISRHKMIDLLRIEGMFQEMWDKRSNVGVARTLVLLLERKAKMLGYDAPTQLQIDDWRSEAKNLGVDPDTLFRDMVNFVGERIGLTVSPPVLDLEPELPRLADPNDDDGDYAL